MNFKSIGWLLVLLFTVLAAFLAGAVAWIAGAGWVLGLLGAVWTVFVLADLKRWVPLRDAAWAANVGFGFSVIRWFDLPAETVSGPMRLMLLGAGVLCLVFFALVAPALLGWIAQRLWPPPEPELPVERPASPEALRRWDPKD
ncbi:MULTISPECIES: hypothetical protein [unclassified Variovorax]|jgi:hypothetical protein|uniref:hypothetical protein n=1 Tax=unclassified Variovorax TaxID=663243 RepID=UPI000F7E1A70|nr:MULTISPECIES: hypothetical protein [unclassified Variovorax]RSZ35270.1 hypothetical protein EJO70_25785 [Variovorax sp. 553]RSZ35714.1 hypothetical protein EJO71_24705 [Variovorax sp. 679]